MFAIRAERDYVIEEDFMKAARKVSDNKKLESKLDYKPVWYGPEISVAILLYHVKHCVSFNKSQKRKMRLVWRKIFQYGFSRLWKKKSNKDD